MTVVQGKKRTNKGAVVSNLAQAVEAAATAAAEAAAAATAANAAAARAAALAQTALALVQASNNTNKKKGEAVAAAVLPTSVTAGKQEKRGGARTRQAKLMEDFGELLQSLGASEMEEVAAAGNSNSGEEGGDVRALPMERLGEILLQLDIPADRVASIERNDRVWLIERIANSKVGQHILNGDLARFAKSARQAPPSNKAAEEGGEVKAQRKRSRGGVKNRMRKEKQNAASAASANQGKHEEA